ncbi:AlpA family transcriptional regulator [Rheinheimera sp.]|uniref:helix-turn-helix transcriptional regulator n=1 Tax=Rheinheimera sp. TaxID=1869214 RepID=UPI0027BAFB8C|nr:helix-turn-helix domain-containing protein [Rheinheimera sp.]
MSLKLLSTKDAAEVLGVSVAFLERDRWAGARVPFVKVGSRAVRYRMSDLTSYIDGNVFQSTSQAGAHYGR